MAKKDQDPAQPTLLDFGAKPALARDPRVEYDLSTVRVRKTGAKPAPDESEEAPWWKRVHSAHQASQEPPPVQATWGAEWHRLLRAEGWTVELAAGKRILLEAAVRGLEIRPGIVEASVGEGSERPQRVQLRMPPISVAEWTRMARHVVDSREEDLAIRDVERNAVPLSLVDAADRHSIPLLPRRVIFMVAACTCGGARLPCDHLLAVHLMLARRLYREPNLLLAFRGIQRQELVELLGRIRLEASAGATTPAGASQADPYARPDGPEPAWERLRRPPSPRPPLPMPEGWRATESFDALVQRLLAQARSAG